MRPNLSIERLAVTLAALGTTAVVTACTRAEPAATGVSPDKSPMSSAASPPPPPPQVAPEEQKKTEGEKEATTASASARPITPAPTKRRAPGDKGSTGQASCGAGTCTADPKKK